MDSSPSTGRLVNQINNVVSTSRDLDDVMRKLWTGSSQDEMLEEREMSDTASLAIQERPCVLCERNFSSNQMSKIINAALFKKHCFSMNQYYCRDISKIVNEEYHQTTLIYMETCMMNAGQEYMSRYYKTAEFPKRFDMLWKFHQFSKTRPGMFDQGTFEIICRNYYYKRRLHEKAIRKMLDKLSSSELKEANVDLDQFMADSIVIEENHCGNFSRFIEHEKVQPFKVLAGQDLKSALKGAIGKQASDTACLLARRDSNIKRSYQILYNSVEEVKCALESKLDNVMLPSFVNNSPSIKKPKNKQSVVSKDLSDYFKKNSKGFNVSEIRGEYCGKAEETIVEVQPKEVESTVQEKGELECLEGMWNGFKKVNSSSQNKLMKKKKEHNKENRNPNTSMDADEPPRRLNKNSEKITEETGSHLFHPAKAKRGNSKNSTTLYNSKQSKISGLLSTKEDERQHNSKEHKLQFSMNDSKHKLPPPSTQTDREPDWKPLKNLKIIVPDHEKFDLQTIKSIQNSMKCKPGDLKKMIKQGGNASKKKLNITEIEKFLLFQMQTPSDAQTTLLQRQNSKEKRIDSTASHMETRRFVHILESKEKKSVSKERKPKYFIAQNYEIKKKKGSQQGGSGVNSRYNSKEKLGSRLGLTAHLNSIHQNSVDPKMKTMEFAGNKTMKSFKAVPSFMSSRRLHEDKNQPERSRKKIRKALGSSQVIGQSVSSSRLMGEATSRIFFAKESRQSCDKDPIRLSRIISPKNMTHTFDKLPLSTMRLHTSKTKRNENTEIRESCNQFRKLSANKSCFDETMKPAIRCPKPKRSKSKKTKDEKAKKVRSNSRNKLMKTSLASINLSRDCYTRPHPATSSIFPTTSVSSTSKGAGRSPPSGPSHLERSLRPASRSMKMATGSLIKLIKQIN